MAYSRINTHFNLYTSSNSDNSILSLEQFNDFINFLKTKESIIDQDYPLLNKYIKEFPINFDQLCGYIKQIYKFEIEDKININLINLKTSIEFIINLADSNVLKEDNTIIYKLLECLLKSNQEMNESVKKITESKKRILNIKEDILRLVWRPILNMEVYYSELYRIYEESNLRKSSQVNENENLNGTTKMNLLSNTMIIFYKESRIQNSYEYSSLMRDKIEYEFEIIKTRKVIQPNKQIKQSMKLKSSKVIIEILSCADKDIPIEVYKVPFNFYDEKTIESIYNMSDALKELLLSKYFKKFLGYDDFTSNDYHVYFFEYIDKKNLNMLIKEKEIDLFDSSMIYIYFSKEILLSLRDLIYKSTYSFEYPIGLEEIYYEVKQKRLLLEVSFKNRRESIYESHEILESMVIVNFGLILIDLLLLNNSHDSKYSQLLYIKDRVFYLLTHYDFFNSSKILYDESLLYEDILYKALENQFIISIIIECLITGYKQCIEFSKYYEKKGKSEFEKIKPEKQSEGQGKGKDFQHLIEYSIPIDERNADKYVSYGNYLLKKDYSEMDKDKKNFEIVVEVQEEEVMIMTLNKLLFHPVFINCQMDEEYLGFIFG